MVGVLDATAHRDHAGYEPVRRPSRREPGCLAAATGRLSRQGVSRRAGGPAGVLLPDRSEGPPRPPTARARFALVVLTMLFVSERSWKHHFVTLLLPYTYLVWEIYFPRKVRGSAGDLWLLCFRSC